MLDQISDKEDLLAAGVNSGELIRLALRCEDHIGRALTDDELARITSIAEVSAILEGSGVAS